MAIKVAPSIFAADFSDMKSAIRKMETAGVDWIHYDVMDNHFVPNISFGPKFIQDIAAQTDIFGDMHLMIDLDRNADIFFSLNVENITIHLESTQNSVIDYIKKIKDAGKQAGISIKPKTPVAVLVPYLDEIDLVLIMSVEPGFSGQKFQPVAVDKVRELVNLIGDRKIDIQVDGGVARDTYRELTEAGATNLVMGSAFFKDPDPGELTRMVRNDSVS